MRKPRLITAGVSGTRSNWIIIASPRFFTMPATLVTSHWNLKERKLPTSRCRKASHYCGKLLAKPMGEAGQNRVISEIRVLAPCRLQPRAGCAPDFDTGPSQVYSMRLRDPSEAP